MADLMFRCAKARSSMMGKTVQAPPEKFWDEPAPLSAEDDGTGVLVSQFPPCEFQNTKHPFQTSKRSLDSLMKRQWENRQDVGRFA